MKVDSKDLALTVSFTSLYVVINLVQAFSVGNPAISGPVQLRVADCLIPLAALLGWPVVAGVTVGCIVTNSITFTLGAFPSTNAFIADVTLGPLANLVAATFVLLLRKHQLLGSIVSAFPIGMIVGGYLWLFFTPPDILNLSLPAWLAMMGSITLSSLIATGVVGYSLLRVLSRRGIVESLKARGLKIDE